MLMGLVIRSRQVIHSAARPNTARFRGHCGPCDTCGRSGASDRNESSSSAPRSSEKASHRPTPGRGPGYSRSQPESIAFGLAVGAGCVGLGANRPEIQGCASLLPVAATVGVICWIKNSGCGLMPTSRAMPAKACWSATPVTPNPGPVSPSRPGRSWPAWRPSPAHR